MILELCKGVHCGDLDESFQTHIYLQNLASIQPRTSPLKFVGSRDSWVIRFQNGLQGASSSGPSARSGAAFESREGRSGPGPAKFLLDTRES